MLGSGSTSRSLIDVSRLHIIFSYNVLLFSFRFIYMYGSVDIKLSATGCNGINRLKYSANLFIIKMKSSMRISLISEMAVEWLFSGKCVMRMI